jgi:hypothetical protein
MHCSFVGFHFAVLCFFLFRCATLGDRGVILGTKNPTSLFFMSMWGNNILKVLSVMFNQKYTATLVLHSHQVPERLDSPMCRDNASSMFSF